MEDFDNPNSVLDNSQSGVSKDDTNIDSTLNNITSEAQKKDRSRQAFIQGCSTSYFPIYESRSGY
jgi:hypothetical protein